MDTKFAAANVKSGFYRTGPDVYYVSGYTESFKLRSRETPAMLIPARVPVAARLEDCDDPVLTLLGETADTLVLCRAQPGFYKDDREIFLCVCEQVIRLGDGASRGSLPAGARRLGAAESEAIEENYSSQIADIYRRMRLGKCFRVV